MSKQTWGFTVVELLVVIVVIGIIASITTVAYLGIQAEARTTAIVQAVTQYKKAIDLYAARNNNDLPLSDSVNSVCLGAAADYPQSGKCGLAVWGLSADSVFEAEMKKIMGNELPKFTSKCYDWGTNDCRYNAAYIGNSGAGFTINGKHHLNYIMYYVETDDCQLPVLGVDGWPNFKRSNPNKYTEKRGNYALCMLEMEDY